MKLFTIMISTYRDKNEITEARAYGTPYVCVCLPWDMIAPHECQAYTNHSQTLARLDERGGLSACEAIAVLEDRAWRQMPPGSANHALCRKVADWIDANDMSDPTPVDKPTKTATKAKRA